MNPFPDPKSNMSRTVVTLFFIGLFWYLGGIELAILGAIGAVLEHLHDLEKQIKKNERHSLELLEEQDALKEQIKKNDRHSFDPS